MDILSAVLLITGAIVFLTLFITIFKKPIKWVFKLLINTLFGFVILFIVNCFGAYIGVQLSVGWLSALIAGVFGIPGVILLLLIENFFI